VAFPETPGPEESSVTPPPPTPEQAAEFTPPAPPPSPPPSLLPATAVSVVPARRTPTGASAAVRPVEATKAPAPAPASASTSVPAAPASASASVPAAHQGGLWSPGAALAELVSELRTEDARRLSGPEADAAPAAKAAQVVSEQRASRERLALMSASEEPTSPVPAVTGRPQKAAVAATSRPARPKEAPVDRWLRRGLVLVVFFAVGMVGALLLLRAF
jgi:hypothetical protein